MKIHELDPDFNWVGSCRSFFTAEFVRNLRKYAVEGFSNEDFLNLPVHFRLNCDLRPNFPRYIVEYAKSVRSKLKRVYRFYNFLSWNPVTTLVGLLALEGMMQLCRFPEEEIRNYALLLRVMLACPYWVNDMDVDPTEISTLLAIDTFSGAHNSVWIDQLVLQLSDYMQISMSNSSFV